MSKLRTLNFETERSFSCGGRKFYLHDSISFNRYIELQKFVLEFGFGATFQEIFKNIRVAYDHLNNLRLADGAVALHNIMYGVIRLDDKEDTALRIAALFINEDNEDVTVYDEAKVKDKIACWATELDATPFFRLAVSIVPAWTTAFRFVSQIGSKSHAENEKQD